MDFIIFLMILAPLTIIVHEIGHVIAASFFQVNKIEMNIGTGKVIHSIKRGKVRLTFHILVLGGASTQTELESSSNFSDRLISLGGPLVNLLLFFFLFPFIEQSVRYFQLFIYFNAWMAIINLIPFKLGTKKSDGWRFLETYLSSKKV